jgi:prophage maintenance system killer protein/prophage antirepressor-like protein
MKKIKKEMIIYQAKTGAIELKGDFKHETIWATQAQIVSLFGVDQSVVSRHINNVFKDGEVDSKSNMQKMHNANSDKPVIIYSLDVILSVGYRTNSSVAISFRQWATKTLREHIVKGYTLNRKRIAQNYDQFLKAVESVKALLPAEVKVDTSDILELIKIYADTWVSLSAYDQEKFSAGKVTKKKVALAGHDLVAGIAEFKKELQKQGEASELFATEKNQGAVEGIMGNVMQTFGGKELYPSVESKAAHLLYFMVKNHPFTDGNKRSGAFAFVWFLRKAGRLDVARLNSAALTALTLLIAESQPKEKDNMTSLVAMLLGK